MLSMIPAAKTKREVDLRAQTRREIDHLQLATSQQQQDFAHGAELLLMEKWSGPKYKFGQFVHPMTFWALGSFLVVGQHSAEGLPLVCLGFVWG
jgi:hypothetical protein